MLFKKKDTVSGKTWRSIPGFSEYEVSEYGEVRRSVNSVRTGRGWWRKKPGELLRPASRGKPYPTLMLVSDSGDVQCRRLHELVAAAFLEQPALGLNTLCHRNDNGNDNHYSNLYWGTAKTNARDKAMNGSSQLGEKGPNAKFSNAEVASIRSQHSSGATQRGLARKYGVSQSTIFSIVRFQHYPEVV